MIIRDYKPDDYTEVTALWDDLGMGGIERGDTPETIDQTISMGGKLLIMEDSKKNIIVGSSWMTFDGRRISIHHFGIGKSHQRKGLGSMLTKESLKFIKHKGYQVKLEVHKNNNIAKHLYERAGFFAFTDYDIYMIRKINEL